MLYATNTYSEEEEEEEESEEEEEETDMEQTSTVRLHNTLYNVIFYWCILKVI